MHDREAEAPVVPAVVTMIVVDVTGTTVVGVADDQTIAAASMGKDLFKTPADCRPYGFLLQLFGLCTSCISTYYPILTA